MNNFFKKAVTLCAGIIFLSGCATYKFQRGGPPYDKGYLALRDDKALLEYTLGKDNSVPGIKLAKERFKRRKRVVEDYYKRMGVIQNHFTMTVWEPVITLTKVVGGTFRLPFIAISDFRYERNPKYRERIRKIEDERDLREAERIKKFKDKLNAYVEKDLAKESSLSVYQQTEEQIVMSVKEKLAAVEEERAVILPEPKTQEAVSRPEEKTEARPVVEQSAPEQDVEQVEQLAQQPVEQEFVEEAQIQETLVPQEEKEKTEIEEVKEVLVEAGPEEQIIYEKDEEQVELVEQQPAEEIKQDQGIQAKITAKPEKGYSPLRVQFNGRRSSSLHGRIVSYFWDFGDGETSAKPKPVNTYWSTTYGSRYYTATLTVKDDKGNSSISSITIEVLTK